MAKKTPADVPPKPGDELVKASYNAGVASGRIAAIEESMDAIATLIFKAEGLLAGIEDSAMRENANHTLRALQLAFGAVTGSASGSPAFRELLEQSRQRIQKKAATMH